MENGIFTIIIFSVLKFQVQFENKNLLVSSFIRQNNCLDLSADSISIFQKDCPADSNFSLVFLKYYLDLSAYSIFVLHLHPKLDLRWSPVTTLSFNGISLLSLIQFFFIWFGVSRLKFLVHSKSTVVAYLDVQYVFLPTIHYLTWTCRLLSWLEFHSHN